MAKFEYDVDYRKQYPGVTISDDVLAALKENDLKRKYFEYDLKVEKPPRKKKKLSEDKFQDATPSQEDSRAMIPSREDSLERLTDLQKQFASPEDVEEIVIQNIMLDKLHHCLAALTELELELVQAIFYEGKTQTELEDYYQISQQGISRRLKKVLKKLARLMKT